MYQIAQIINVFINLINARQTQDNSKVDSRLKKKVFFEWNKVLKERWDPEA
jgi:hypothetical protein